MAMDQYANIATLEVTQSAANTLTYGSLQTQLGFMTGTRDKALAMIIDQIDYRVSNSALQEMDADTDSIFLGITISDSPTSLTDFSDRRILNHMELNAHAVGTAGNAIVHKQPFVHQFFPPLIHAERVLYLGMDSTGLGSASAAQARIYYRVREITAAELVELTEVFRLVG